jgi:hypothetical protein
MITYGITVADEFFEFKRLVDNIQAYIREDEEIVILADSNKITSEIVAYADLCKLKVNYFNFQNNFSDFKNQLLLFFFVLLALLFLEILFLVCHRQLP